jgi:cellulose biosynthesis protein BcsQ
VQILALYNLKGGVGKTAATVNLAFLAALEGARSLVWDLDPQGAASFYFRVQPKIEGGGKRLLRGEAALDDWIKGTDFPGLDLLPADFSYRHMDRVLHGFKHPQRRLRKRLAPLAPDYEYVFLDCPPGISLVSEGVFETADVLLVPLIPTTLSLRTLDRLMAFLQQHPAPGLQVLPFFSMADRRKRLHREVMEQLPTHYPDMLQAVVPMASEVERMGLRRAPLASFAPACPAADGYAALWEEIKGRIMGGHAPTTTPQGSA